MDRTTKILLAAIALGLWANAGVSALRPATAQLGGLPGSHLSHYDAKDLASAVVLIANGQCMNSKLC
jgi:hypothetical protein